MRTFIKEKTVEMAYGELFEYRNISKALILERTKTFLKFLIDIGLGDTFISAKQGDDIYDEDQLRPVVLRLRPERTAPYSREVTIKADTYEIPPNRAGSEETTIYTYDHIERMGRFAVDLKPWRIDERDFSTKG